MPDKQKHPVKLTLGALQANDAMQKPRSSMKQYVSSKDPYGKFAVTGTSGQRLRETEMELKGNQRGSNGANEKAWSSRKADNKDGGKKKVKDAKKKKRPQREQRG